MVHACSIFPSRIVLFALCGGAVACWLAISQELAKVDGVSDFLAEDEEGERSSLGLPPDPPLPIARGAVAVQALRSGLPKYATICLEPNGAGGVSVGIEILDEPYIGAAAAALALTLAPPSSKVADLDVGAAAAAVPISKDEAAHLLAGLLVEALRHSYGRVIDLFRSWDENKDGSVTKKEFRNALPLLQVNGDVSLAEVDALFDSFDVYYDVG